MEVKIRSPVSENLRPTGDPGCYLIYCSYLLLFNPSPNILCETPTDGRDTRRLFYLMRLLEETDFGPVLSPDRREYKRPQQARVMLEVTPPRLEFEPRTSDFQSVLFLWLTASPV